LRIYFAVRWRGAVLGGGARGGILRGAAGVRAFIAKISTKNLG